MWVGKGRSLGVGIIFLFKVEQTFTMYDRGPDTTGHMGPVWKNSTGPLYLRLTCPDNRRDGLTVGKGRAIKAGLVGTLFSCL